MLKLLRRKSKDDAKKELLKHLDGYEVPSFSNSALRVLQMLRDANSETAEIARSIEVDPGIHIKVLRTVNSAAYGLSNQVSSINQAVALLGRSRLEALIVSVAVNATVNTGDMGDFDTLSFWRGSAQRATIAKSLAGLLHAATRSEAMTAGLLLDIAVPVIARSKGKSYLGLLDTWKSDPERGLATLEHDAFGFDHGELGGLMAVQWGLPQYLVDAIATHHSENEPACEPAVRLAADVRDSTDPDDVERLVLRSAEHGLAADVVRDQVERSNQEAQDLSEVLC